MDSRSDLQAKLAYLTVKLSDSPEALSAEERQKHLDMLRDVMNAMGSMEKDLKKAVDESNPDACILRVVGGFQKSVDGSCIYPTRKEVQQKFKEFHDSIRVQALTIENNFNYIQNGPGSGKFLMQEEELFVRFGSAEEMQYVLDCNFNLHVQVDLHAGCTSGCNIQFVKPALLVKRDTYRTIGNLILNLKTVDQKCRALEAIPGKGGVPILPDQMVQTEQFDETVKSFEENVEDVSGKLKHGLSTPLGAKQYLHAYLCSKTRVDKRKRQTALDPLIDERIEILKKLAQFDTDEFPFTYEREFK